MEYVYESQPSIIEQDARVTLRIALTGLILGIVAAVLTYTLERFVIANLVCGGEATCRGAASYAGGVATVFAGIVGVIALVRAGVYRPIIITVGTAISLWGVSIWLFGAGVLMSLLLTAFLYAVAYVTYGWLVRIRKAPIMLIVCGLVAAASVAIPMMLP